MAKGLRSKTKRHFRTQKRQVLSMPAVVWLAPAGADCRATASGPARLLGGHKLGRRSCLVGHSKSGARPSCCRETVAQAPWQLEAERKKQELMQASVSCFSLL